VALTHRPARFDVWNREAFGDPAHGLPDTHAEHTHHEIDVGVSPLHVTDETADAIAALMEMQRWVCIAVSVILWSPALCTAVTDSQT
jgi:hypothetical protein